MRALEAEEAGKSKCWKTTLSATSAPGKGIRPGCAIASDTGSVVFSKTSAKMCENAGATGPTSDGATLQKGQSECQLLR